jgi:23S rRNA (cytidine1920-2'-O)/16S rRNA (cytidine1409-2'-O)-methyltransferase
MKNVRLDVFLAENGISLSREKAKKEILAGWVTVNSETVRNPSAKIKGDETVNVQRPGSVYVSRGGDKLKHALDVFAIDLTDKTALDLGASTGGFTDCMLKAGAARVYSVDVGYNQLDYSLRIDNRVVVMEKTHARDISEDMFPGGFDFFTADLSFISILKVLPSVINICRNIEGVVLLKPQFEAMPGQHKKGVVRSISDHEEILERVLKGIIEMGFSLKGLTWSPVKGPAGNIEFLAYISAPSVGNKGDLYQIVKEITMTAHNMLNKLTPDPD